LELIRTKHPNLSTIVFTRFEKFIDENSENLKDNALISFAFPISNFNLISTLDSINKNYEDVFFFKATDESYSYIAINRLIELCFQPGNVLSIAPNISDIRSKIFNNWSEFNLVDLPIITGAVNFSADHINDNWKDFGENKLVVPEFIIYQQAEDTFIIFNNLYSTLDNSDEHLNKIDQIINSVLFSNQSNNNNSVVSIVKNGVDENEKQQWDNLIVDAKGYLKSSLSKIVLSRKIEIEATDNVKWSNLIEKLNDDNPECYIFMYKSNDAVFFGASPEKFLSVQDKFIDIDAMAGSAAGDSTDVASELLNKKNLKEHKIVTDFICDTLSIYAENVIAAEQPLIIKLSDVQHLHTKIAAQLQSKEKVLSLIDSLFPTPAVCGIPKDEALKAIRELETHDRGLYSGLIGWINPEMNCEFAVAIRSAFYKKNKLSLYAGSGIVEESVPEDEFLETELKLKTILKLFNGKNTR
jgi:menaquinone-specific isochorismate synthase